MGSCLLLSALLCKISFAFILNFSKNWCENWLPWPHLPVVWHQAHLIWLMMMPWPPNSYLLWGHFIFEVVVILKALKQEFLCLILWLVTGPVHGQSKTLSHIVRVTSNISQLRVRAYFALLRQHRRLMASAIMTMHVSGWKKYFWSHDAMKCPRKSLKKFIVSNPVNEFRLQLYLFCKVREDTFLYSSPIQIRSPTQKLVFKVKIKWGHGPRGGLGGQTPLESEVFFHLKS